MKLLFASGLFSSRDRIRSWKAFYQAASNPERPLLSELHRFPDSVLVAGCQRSGTTALTRVIANSHGFAKFRITHDDELDAALILAGYEQYAARGRHCFQTTYINNRFLEYLDPKNAFRLVWVIRDPHSVVHSMTYHWRRAALERLFDSCGRAAADEYASRTGTNFRNRKMSRIEKACFAYVGKTGQLDRLAAGLPAERLIVIDYERLCRTPEPVLLTVFRFIGETYTSRYAKGISAASLEKGERLSNAESRLVDRICLDTYSRVSRHTANIANGQIRCNTSM